MTKRLPHMAVLRHVAENGPLPREKLKMVEENPRGTLNLLSCT